MCWDTLLGNLQIFLGPEQINRYARFLHAPAALLWAVRVFLLTCLVVHITASLQLWRLKRKARPVQYYKKDDLGGDYASRTMMWSGPIIAAFVVFHILHLTAGDVPGLALDPENVYQNVVRGFQHPVVSIAYIFAISLLTTHLYHGSWSMFQCVGANHPRYTPVLQCGAKIVAILIAIGVYLHSGLGDGRDSGSITERNHGIQFEVSRPARLSSAGTSTGST